MTIAKPDMLRPVERPPTDEPGVAVRLGRYPFTGTLQERLEWQDLAREALEAAGYPTGEHYDPSVVGCSENATVYISWFTSRHDYGEGWTAEAARDACRKVFVEFDRIEAERVWDAFFTIAMRYRAEEARQHGW